MELAFATSISADRPSAVGSIDWPVALASAIIAAATLYTPQLGSIAVLVGLAGLLLVVTLRPVRFLGGLAGSWLIFVLIGWMFASWLWSAYPATTLYYSTLYVLTILIGIAVGGVAGEAALIGLFASFGVYALSSVAFGHSVAWGAEGQTAFSGLTGGKNYVADTSTLGAIFSLHMMADAAARRRILVLAVATGFLLVQIYLISAARSSGAVIGLIQSIVLFAAFLSFRRLPLTARTSVLVATLCILALAIASQKLWLPGLTSTVADAFGKDVTLTGRTYLWARAQDSISAHPWLGTGFYAYWVQGNIDAEGLWRIGGIDNRMGFNFHNSAIEMMVEIGMIGFIIAAAVLAIYFVRLVLAFVGRPSIGRATWLVVLLYEIARMPYEAIGYGTFAYSTIFIVAGLAAGSGHGASDRRPARPARRRSVRADASLRAALP